MTNFSRDSTSVNRWLTPESALVLIPASAGGIVSIILALYLLVPAIHRLQRQNTLLTQAQNQVSELPTQKRELDKTLSEYSLVLAKHKRAMNLLTGTSDLDTLYAEINLLINSERVSILNVSSTTYHSYTPPTAAESERRPSNVSAGTTTKDSLLLPKVEKRIIELTLEGSFLSILSLMRKIELLQSMVLIGDLTIESLDGTKSQLGNSSSLSSPLRATLKLTAYGKAKSLS